MKKIGLISDTHSFLDPKVFKHFEHCDEVWHAGDIGNEKVADELENFKPLRAVYGNIDDSKLRLRYPLDNQFMCEDVSVWMTHIGGYPNRYNQRVRNILNQNPPPQLFICGHSHILKVIYDKKYQMLTMNPGAYGISGFHKVRTLLRFEIDGKKIQKLEVIETAR